MQFTVGIKLNGKAQHVAAQGEDALIAALKVKAEHPECRITYIRPMNKRSDARHPGRVLPVDLH